MNDTLQKADELIKSIASKMGMAADHFYPILLKQQVVSAWLWIIAAVCAWAILIGGTFFICKATKSVDDEGTVFGFITCIGIITLFISIVAFSSIGQIINPEYYALTEILTYLK